MGFYRGFCGAQMYKTADFLPSGGERRFILYLVLKLYYKYI